MSNLPQLIKTIICSLTLLMSLPAFSDTEIFGAGSTFINPVISTWEHHFKSETGLKINYQPIGSTEGIKRVVARSVDFAISDIPLTESDLQQAELIQVPILAGGVTPVINLPGIEANHLKLTGDVIAKIYLGEITNWDDASIRSLNPDLTLPSLPIVPIYRSEGSGTSYVFTYFLSQSNKLWHDKIGVTSKTALKTGRGALGTQDVVNFVKSIEGAIGYMATGYAENFGLKTPLLLNNGGHYVVPNQTTIAAAVNASKDLPGTSYRILVNQPGPNSWPMVAFSYVLLPKVSENIVDTQQTLQFLDWAYSKGTSDVVREGYMPISPAMQQAEVVPSLKKIIDKNGLAVKK